MESSNPFPATKEPAVGNSTETTTFEVSKVAPANTLLHEVTYKVAIESLLTSKVEACSSSEKRLLANTHLYSTPSHHFLEAVYLAFNDHRPLVLSPDMIWLLIAQGFANHINANAEKLRSRFVKHQGKCQIFVRRDDFIKGSSENPWPEVFDEFSSQIRSHIGEESHNLFLPNFSTTGPTEQAAMQIVLLDAMRSYFDYNMTSICGIPRITLEGTLLDWQRLVKRANFLAQFELGWWIEPLVPILNEFISAIEGRINTQFWQSIYQKNSKSGRGDYVTGWVTVFFPYLMNRQTEQVSEKNLWIIEASKSSWIVEIIDQDWLYDDDLDVYKDPKGVRTSAFPNGLAKAPFNWQHSEHSYKMEFLGGFVGVYQDHNSLALRPEIGWAVREADDAADLSQTTRVADDVAALSQTTLDWLEEAHLEDEAGLLEQAATGLSQQQAAVEWLKARLKEEEEAAQQDISRAEVEMTFAKRRYDEIMRVHAIIREELEF